MPSGACRAPPQFVVGRWSNASLEPSIIQTQVMDSVFALANKGFAMVGVALDGAGENEKMARDLCTLSLRDLGCLPVSGAPGAEWAALSEEALDMKIAWPSYASPIDPIFLIADMGHVVKRIVNALFHSSCPANDREMTIAVHERPGEAAMVLVPMCLGMLKDAWRELEAASAGSSLNGEVLLCMWLKSTLDYWIKDAFNCMRVPLVVAALSDSTVRMIDEHCARKESDYRRMYSGIRQLAVRVNRLVDICNCRGDVTPPALALNRPDHDGVKELLETVRFFEAWRSGIDTALRTRASGAAWAGACARTVLTRICAAVANLLRRPPLREGEGAGQAARADGPRHPAPLPRHRRDGRILHQGGGVARRAPPAGRIQPAACAVRPLQEQVSAGAPAHHGRQPHA